MNNHELHQKTFLLLLVVTSVAFGWLILPFYSAVFWAIVLAIVFAPVYHRLLSVMRHRQNLAAVSMVLLCLFIVVIPVTLLAASLMQEGLGFYQKIRSRELDFGTYFQQFFTALPTWMQSMLERSGMADIAAIRDRLSSSAAQGSQFIATHVIQIGQNVFSFLISMGIMLYLLFFLFRDGDRLSAKIQRMIPLSPEYKQPVFRKLTTVIRATIKGNIVVAAVQGALGGAMFWILDIQGALLWGVLMAFLSLLPAIGSGFVWGPVALYFFATDSFMKGAILVGFGLLVIGLIDNLLRPILVGKDTQIPDYIVFISTVGGLAIFGLNGFVIGPVIAAAFIAFWEIFDVSSRKKEETKTE